MAINQVALLLLMLSQAMSTTDDSFLYGEFPKRFQWGAATASYQIEGGWNQEGKGPSIWDDFSQQPGKVVDGSSGEVACDSYNKVEEDVKLLKNLGVDFYRFSIAWPRIVPKGRNHVANTQGISYYKRLIHLLIDNNIQPMVTLYHWDLPLDVHENDGWLNAEVVDDFKFYAKTCFEQFGDKVKRWITFNEPEVFIAHGYETGDHAPGLRENPATDPYIAAKNVLMAHAGTYRLYQDSFKDEQNGEVGITLNSAWCEPGSDSSIDKEAANRKLEFELGIFAQPIFGNGDFPESVKRTIAEKSKKQNLQASRLPDLSSDEKESIKGTADFFGLNHYTTSYVVHEDHDTEPASFRSDENTKVWQDSAWPSSGSRWLKVVPWGLRKLLIWIKDNYDRPRVIITENGVSDNTGQLDDEHRIQYYKLYTNEVFKAIKLDDCDVIGYTAWSLLDNFEWARGYTEKFGLVQVDFNDPARPRKPKDSYKWYAKLIKFNGFDKHGEKWHLTEYQKSCFFYLGVAMIVMLVCKRLWPSMFDYWSPI